MTVSELLESEYAFKFGLNIPNYRDDVIYIHSRDFVSIPTKELKITEHEGFLHLEVEGRFHITLYLDSGTTHTAIF